MSIDRADKKYWKLGVFYLNKEDKSLFVPKRFGMGTTFNLAHPISFVIIATLCL